MTECTNAKKIHAAGEMSGLSPDLLSARPDFFVLAPPRSGSTWLFQNLKAHPQVFIPEMKEIKFFSNYHELCGLDWYLTCFRDAKGRKRGEVSPSYAILPDRLIEEVKRIAPDLRLVFLFRDPVERSWSHLKHQFRLRESVFSKYTGTFEEIAGAKIMDGLLNSWTVAYSDYLAVLQRWLKVYPKEQVLIDFFETAIEKPEPFLKKVFSHLNLALPADWSAFPIQQTFNQGLQQDMPADVQEIMTTFYSGRVKAFADFIGKTFHMEFPSNWRYLLEKPENGMSRICFSDPGNQSVLEEVLRRETVESTHVQALEENYQGYKIIAYQGACLALSRTLRGIDIVHTSKSELETHKREHRIFSGETLAEVKSVVDASGDGFSGKWERLVESKERIIAEKTEAIGAKAARIEELHSEISNREQTIGKLSSELAARDQVIEEKRQAIEAKAARIEELHAEISNREQTIGKLNSELMARDQVIEEKRQAIEAKAARIEELHAEISNREQLLKELRAMAEGRSKQFEALNSKVDQCFWRRFLKCLQCKEK